MNREMFTNNQPKPQPQGMTVEEATFALDLIRRVSEQDFDGSIPSLGRVLILMQTLFQAPELWWETYFYQTSSERDRELHDKAREFIARPEFDAHSIEQLRQFSETV